MVQLLNKIFVLVLFGLMFSCSKNNSNSNVASSKNDATSSGSSELKEKANSVSRIMFFKNINGQITLAEVAELPRGVVDPIGTVKTELSTLDTYGPRKANFINDKDRPAVMESLSDIRNVYWNLEKSDIVLENLEATLSKRGQTGFLRIVYSVKNPKVSFIDYVTLERVQQIRKLEAFSLKYLLENEKVIFGEIAPEDFMNQLSAGFVSYRDALELAKFPEFELYKSLKSVVPLLK